MGTWNGSHKISRKVFTVYINPQKLQKFLSTYVVFIVILVYVYVYYDYVYVYLPDGILLSSAL